MKQEEDLRAAAGKQAIPEAEVVRCDVAIIGGGIAGVACAERLAREARRQQVPLRILLIEQEAELGASTSGGLEGWFHAGALYAKLDDPRFFTHCLNAFEDLYNWYRFDKAFEFNQHCNLESITKDKKTIRYDFTSSPSPHWFVNQISYLVPRNVVGIADSHDARWAGSEWRKESTRAKWHVGQAFWKCDWWNPHFDCCQAPHVGSDVQTPHEGSEDLSFEDVLRKCLKEDRTAAMTEFEARKKALDSIMEAMTRDAENHGHDVTIDPMLSRDAVMNTRLILSDLVSAAASQGVKFLTGCTLDPSSVQVARTSPKVDVMIVRGPGGNVIQILAEQYVFALGFGFEEGDFLRSQLGVRVRIEKKLSVMVVRCPPFCTQSFVRLDHSPQYAFNHIYHPGYAPDFPEGYSIIADANALSETAGSDECAREARLLLEKASRVFGDVQQGRRLGWYACKKTEFIALEDTQRDYSYRVDPRLEQSHVHTKWTQERDKGQKRVQETLKQYVLSGRRNRSVKLVAPITEDGWVLGKVIHFALQRLAWARDPKHPLHRTAMSDFNDSREDAIKALRDAFQARRAPVPNYLCVIPGKFSLFPSLAHQVYIEMELRGLYKDPSGRSTRCCDTKPEAAEAHKSQGSVPMVANTRAENLLSRLTTRNW